MATMASLFLKTPGPSQTLPKTHKTHFILPLNLSLSWRSNYRAGPVSARIRCGLIEPDGGKLVDLVIEEPQRDLKRRQALSLPQIKLSKIDIQWVHVLSEGWASPLKGFMRESEFLQTLHFNSLRLGDGSVVNMSVPIVLAIDDSYKNNIGDSSSVALVDEKDKPIAILNE